MGKGRMWGVETYLLQREQVLWPARIASTVLAALELCIQKKSALGDV